MIFSIPLFLAYYLLQIFSLISMPSHNFWFSVLQALQWAGGVIFVAWKFPGYEFSQTVEFRRLRIFATCTVHLPCFSSSACDLFVSCTTINLQKILSQPFNGHLRAIN